MTIARVLLAVVVAYLVIVALVAIGSVVSMAVFDVSMTSTPPPRYLLAGIVCSMAAAAVGGYVCARLAPAGRVTVTVGLLCAVFLIAGVWAGRANASAAQPLWYQAVVTLLGACGLLSGVVIQRSLEAGSRGGR